MLRVTLTIAAPDTITSVVLDGSPDTFGDIPYSLEVRVDQADEEFTPFVAAKDICVIGARLVNAFQTGMSSSSPHLFHMPRLCGYSLVNG